MEGLKGTGVRAGTGLPGVLSVILDDVARIPRDAPDAGDDRFEMVQIVGPVTGGTGIFAPFRVGVVTEDELGADPGNLAGGAPGLDPAEVGQERHAPFQLLGQGRIGRTRDG